MHCIRLDTHTCMYFQFVSISKTLFHPTFSVWVYCTQHIKYLLQILEELDSLLPEHGLFGVCPYCGHTVHQLHPFLFIFTLLGYSFMYVMHMVVVAQTPSGFFWLKVKDTLLNIYLLILHIEEYIYI